MRTETFKFEVFARPMTGPTDSIIFGCRYHSPENKGEYGFEGDDDSTDLESEGWTWSGATAEETFVNNYEAVVQHLLDVRR
jgi:hypothetical protein